MLTVKVGCWKPIGSQYRLFPLDSRRIPNKHILTDSTILAHKILMRSLSYLKLLPLWWIQVVSARHRPYTTPRLIPGKYVGVLGYGLTICTYILNRPHLSLKIDNIIQSSGTFLNYGKISDESRYHWTNMMLPLYWYYYHLIDDLRSIFKFLPLSRIELVWLNLSTVRNHFCWFNQIK